MSVGIVLGAGGPMGWPWHLGVLEGIRVALGKNAADADIIIGTSAGGAIAASLLAGADTTRVLAAINQPMSASEQQLMRAARTGVLRRPWRLLWPQSLLMLQAGGLVGAVGLAPEGIFPTLAIRRFPIDTLTTWPKQLWLPAVQLGSGNTVIFGRDNTNVDVADAVEATSAVPGLFQPKEIGNDRYIDGAVASATHAAALAPLGLDVIVISSVMTRPGNGPIRRRARRQLAAEEASLEATGSTVVTISPTQHVVDLASGYPRSNPNGGSDIVEAAKQQTVDLLTAVTASNDRNP